METPERTLTMVGNENPFAARHGEMRKSLGKVAAAVSTIPAV
jgi:hypothetical protein